MQLTDHFIGDGRDVGLVQIEFEGDGARLVRLEQTRHHRPVVAVLHLRRG